MNKTTYRIYIYIFTNKNLVIQYIKMNIKINIFIDIYHLKLK
jgi:hypothetical protein